MMNLRQTALHASFSCVALAVTSSLLAACGGGAGSSASSLPATSASQFSAAVSPAAKLTFKTIDNQKDPTFNQLLGINSAGEIVGYFGSGAKGHPNKGYTLIPPYAPKSFTNENYPGSAQTQVTGLNDKGNTVGFWVDAKGTNFGFAETNGVFSNYVDPQTGKGTVNQILGINDQGTAVGFYVNAKGASFGFSLNQASGKFTPVTIAGGTNVAATGINTGGDITGFYNAGNATVGFIRKGARVFTLSYPRSTATTPLGINAHDQIVGSYVDRAKKTHGFLLSNPTGSAVWQSIDDPKGIGNTVINGLNNAGKMVGFYVDASGKTHGMLIAP
jgi:hypothetical protein